jgi:hypothetical protein
MTAKNGATTERLLSSGARTRAATLLDALGVAWTREEDDEGTVTYRVGDGPLEGAWDAQGPDADLAILDEMLAQLEDDWRYHLACYRRVASAMRSIGR